MKEIELTTICDCGYQVQRMYHTNGYGCFEIPDSYCPDCFNLLYWECKELPVTIFPEIIKEKITCP